MKTKQQEFSMSETSVSRLTPKTYPPPNKNRANFRDVANYCQLIKNKILNYFSCLFCNYFANYTSLMYCILKNLYFKNYYERFSMKNNVFKIKAFSPLGVAVMLLTLSINFSTNAEEIFIGNNAADTYQPSSPGSPVVYNATGSPIKRYGASTEYLYPVKELRDGGLKFGDINSISIYLVDTTYTTQTGSSVPVPSPPASQRVFLGIVKVWLANAATNADTMWQLAKTDFEPNNIYTEVFSDSNFKITEPKGWVTFDFPTPFRYDGEGLILKICQYNTDSEIDEPDGDTRPNGGYYYFYNWRATNHGYYYPPGGQQRQYTHRCYQMNASRSVKMDSTCQVLPNSFANHWNITVDLKIDFTEIITYRLDVAIANNVGGTVLGADAMVPEGTERTIRATPAACYRFLYWSDNNTANPRIITVNSDTTFTAYFEQITYNLVVTSNNNDYGTVEGAANNLPCGTTRQIRAIPADCYRFVRWSDGNTQSTRTITLNNNMNLSATFEPAIYNLTATSNNINYGSVVVEGGSASGIPCGGGTTATRTITATAADCYRFVRWSNNSTSPTLQIIVTSDTNLSAIFEPITYNIVLTSNGNGTVAGAANNVACGTARQITATPAACYKFKEWSDGNTESSRTITINDNINLSATFEQTTYNVVVTSNGNGTVEGSASNVACGANRQLTATAADCYRFARWSDGNTQNPRMINNVTSDINLSATFELATYNLLITSVGNGTVTGATNNVPCGASREIKAEAADCYRFQSWSDGNTESSRTIIIARDTNLVATFTIEQYRLDVNSSIGGSVTPSGFSWQDCGSIIPLTAIPDAGYSFANWTSGTTIISTQPTIDIRISSDTSLLANFEEGGGIEEIIKSGVSILPNPASDAFTLSFDVLRSSNMQVVLTDLSGREVLQIYDNFVDAGLFSRIVKTENLARGAYFLQIRIAGNTLAERVVVE